MSGGYFDYNQYRIERIADDIEEVLNVQGKEHSEEPYHYTYPKVVQEKMKEAIKQLRIAAIYAQRVDWFLSGDDGEESFILSLEKELDELD